jgi:hypothetical protein
VESTGIARLIAELLTVVQALTGYTGPAQAPVVELVAHVELQEMACEGTCEVRGWYAGGSTIYLDDRLDPENNMWDRGILVHEIVHYLQEQDGAFGIVPTCRRWLEREEEAYAAQRQWLRANRPNGPPPRYARFPRITIDCDS